MEERIPPPIQFWDRIKPGGVAALNKRQSPRLIGGKEGFSKQSIRLAILAGTVVQPIVERIPAFSLCRFVAVNGVAWATEKVYVVISHLIAQIHLIEGIGYLRIG